MKKLVTLFLAIGIAMSSLTGCGEKDAPPKPVTIQTESSYGATTANGNAYSRLLGEFTKANPHITIKDNSTQADDNWKASIRDKFEAGREPDVTFFFTSADVAGIIEKKQVVSVNTIKTKYPDYGKNIKPEAMKAITEKDGIAYCLPVTGFWEGLFCNEALFEKYNVPMITDWDSLLSAVRIFKSNNITPIAASFADVPNYWIENAILAASGTTKHSINPKTADEIPPEWAEGLDLIADLYHNRAFQADALTTRHNLALQNFNAEKSAMFLDGSWAEISPKISDHVRVAAFPHLDKIPQEEKGVIAGFSMGFYISTKAWNDDLKRDACVKFVEHMTSNDAIAALVASGAPAADVQTPEDADQMTKDGIAICNENKMQMPIDSRLSKSAWEYLTQKTSEIIAGRADSKQVLEKLAEYNN